MKIFIFGSNGTGFHGAGSAGYAFRGESKTYPHKKHPINKQSSSTL
jgi:hypothetical protein